MTKTTYARRPLSGKKWCPVILNEAAGGVKDLRHDNVHEMCPPDSSLTLRMTGRDIQKNIKDKRKSIIISGRFEIPKRHIKKKRKHQKREKLL